MWGRGGGFNRCVWYRGGLGCVCRGRGRGRYRDIDIDIHR
jgi:hypothetical protein